MNVKKLIKSILTKIGPYLVGQSEKNIKDLLRVASLIALQNIYNDPRSFEKGRLLRNGFKAYSGYDDGIIKEIFNRIGVTNKYFVDIGASNGYNCNTMYLLLQGWKGLWVDANKKGVIFMLNEFKKLIESKNLKICHQYVSVENIEMILASYDIPKEIDLLSIDIDGNDYHVLKAIKNYSPRVFVVEYNAKFRPPVLWVMKYNPAHVYDGSDYFGASLKSFELLFEKKGYALVGCNISGVNSYFVRKDLLQDKLWAAPFTSENHYEPYRYVVGNGLFSGHPPKFGEYEQI